jgi:hypothetical protein
MTMMAKVNTKGRTVMPLRWFHELKISFPKYRSNALRIRERGTLATVSYVAIGFFAGASGTYFFEHGFHVSVAGLFSIAGVVTGAAITAGLRWGKLDPAHRARTRNNTAQIRGRWDYRPRDGIQRCAENQGAETVDAVSVTTSGTSTDDTVWFDFVPIDSAAADEPTNSLPQIPTTKVP